ncbi:hypothetical protein TREES_T100007255 [Tupaia chinensis]|uniref:Uncharacterized protein n=1 Tax=Tupaia chinensis TaxID=246437 RepID=L9L0Y9_TUPCH|nr:hypothetical protein TREES_T100007255 [Tupaia chinensis]
MDSASRLPRQPCAAAGKGKCGEQPVPFAFRQNVLVRKFAFAAYCKGKCGCGVRVHTQDVDPRHSPGCRRPYWTPRVDHTVKVSDQPHSEMTLPALERPGTCTPSMHRVAGNCPVIAVEPASLSTASLLRYPACTPAFHTPHVVEDLCVCR